MYIIRWCGNLRKFGITQKNQSEKKKKMPLVIWAPLNHVKRNLIAILVIPRFSASSTLKSFLVSQTCSLRPWRLTSVDSNPRTPPPFSFRLVLANGRCWYKRNHEIFSIHVHPCLFLATESEPGHLFESSSSTYAIATIPPLPYLHTEVEARASNPDCSLNLISLL